MSFGDLVKKVVGEARRGNAGGETAFGFMTDSELRSYAMMQSQLATEYQAKMSSPPTDSELEWLGLYQFRAAAAWAELTVRVGDE